MAKSTLVTEIPPTVKSTPVYQIKAPVAFLFKLDDRSRWKRRFERFRQPSRIAELSECSFISNITIYYNI